MQLLLLYSEDEKVVVDLIVPRPFLSIYIYRTFIIIIIIIIIIITLKLERQYRYKAVHENSKQRKHTCKITTVYTTTLKLTRLTYRLYWHCAMNSLCPVSFSSPAVRTAPSEHDTGYRFSPTNTSAPAYINATSLVS